MMINGTTVKQKDIVLIPFPFSNMTQQKQRPVVVLSDSVYNSKNSDLICCTITSNLRDYAHSISISNNDLESGNLLYSSKVKPNKVFTLEQNKILKNLCRLNILKSKEIVSNLNIFIKIEE